MPTERADETMALELLRRLAVSDDVYFSVEAPDFTVDGYVSISDDEAALLERLRGERDG